MAGKYDAVLLVGRGETCDGGVTVTRQEDADRYQRRAGHTRLATLGTVGIPSRTAQSGLAL